MFLVIVDAHSKWPEVELMTSTTSKKTIEVLRSLFARHGLPEQLVSDNGPQFISDDFKKFLKANQVKHILTAPYHPASNGLAERFVRTLKRSLKASSGDGRPICHRLAEFLFEYRATPHATTGVSPDELFLKRTLRTRFNLMLPNAKEQVMFKQAKQKEWHDEHAKSRSLVPGAAVLARDYSGTDKWVSGIVLQRLGPITYSVEISNGRIVKRHIDQLKPRVEAKTPSDVSENSTVLDNQYYPIEDAVQAKPDIDRAPVRRYPQRQHHPPDRLRYDCHSLEERYNSRQGRRCNGANMIKGFV